MSAEDQHSKCVPRAPRASDPDSGYDSDATIDLEELLGVRPLLFGAPLQRIPNGTGTGSGSAALSACQHRGGEYDSDSCDAWSDDSEQYDSDLDDDEEDSDDTPGGPSSAVAFRVVVNKLLTNDQYFADPSAPIYVPSNGSDAVPYFVKRVAHDSPELAIIQALNSAELRRDPWNPAPRILNTITHDDATFIALQPLRAFDDPPLQTVLDCVELAKQLLEGLVFLHEQRIAGLWPAHDAPSATAVARSIMMDVGARTHRDFDRRTHPVRYYLVDLSHAQAHAVRGADADAKADAAALEPEPLTPTLARMHAEAVGAPCPFRRDVRACARFVAALFRSIPRVVDRMLPLLRAMDVAALSAEECRRFLDRFCASMDSELLNTCVEVDIPCDL